MIALGAPAFLLVGGVATLIVVALHLLVPLPPQRAPLPTARFLSATVRASMQPRRTPQDLLLLLVRCLFALLFAAAFARPVWRSDRDDSAHVVVLDRGVGMAGAWAAAVDSARERAGSAAALLMFDTVPVWVSEARLDAAFFDSLRAAEPTAAEADYRVAFGALANVGGVLPAGTYRASLITAPRWTAWRAGTATSRRAAWPGALELITPSTDVAAAALEREARVAASAGTALRDAVEALGWQAVDESAIGPDVVRFASVGARAGAESRTTLDAAIFPGGWTAPALRTPVAAAGGPVGEVVAVWRNGDAAAATTSAHTGCTVTTSFALDAEPLITRPDYPELVRRLVEACHSRTPPADVASLDSGGLALLRGAGDADVDAGAFPGGAADRSLARPLLAIALLLALAEWPLRQRRPRKAVV